MRLRVPSGCGAISHAGRVVEIGADRCVDVDADAGNALLAHGFIRLSDVSDEPQIKVQSRLSISMQGSDELRNEIERLNRPALFAYLKAKGIRVSLPVTNEELRAMARDRADYATFDSSSGDAT